MAIAARMEIIDTTVNSSIRVKPFFFDLMEASRQIRFLKIRQKHLA
jgi:hypothetical protein